VTEQGLERHKNLTRLLEIAAKKQNESADATCAVARCLSESDEQLADDLFDSIFEEITNLARVSLEKKLDYRRAARELIASVARRTRCKAP
jgi:hypothetical protein